LCAAAFYLAWQVLPKKAPASIRRSLDYPGAVLICGAVALIIIALSGIRAHGFATFQGGGFLAIGLAAFVLFFVYEGRAKDPMTPLSLYRCRDVIGANLTALCMFAGGVGMFLMVSSFMQTVLKFSAMKTGAAMIPYALAVTLGGRTARFALGKWSLRTNIALGLIIGACGMFVLAWVAEFAPNYWAGVVPGICIAGFGTSLTFVNLLADGTAAVPSQRQGVASALVMTSAQMGNAVGASVVLTLFGSAVAAHEPIGQACHAAFNMSAGFIVIGLVILVGLVKGHPRAALAAAPITH
jgi:predicted MFS family arabinose efflux permease